MSLAVIAVLIGLLLPTLSGVRETTRQVVCRSNVRQFGIGIALFADDNRRDRLPPSVYAITQPHRTTQVRRDDPQPWDGLGLLYSNGYLQSPGVYYCPSHAGSHPQGLYADRWAIEIADLPSNLRDIYSNYQYRGGSAGSQYLPDLVRMRPRAAIVTDSLRSQEEANHQVGVNVLRADLSANWYSDLGRRLVDGLPQGTDADSAAANKVSLAWDELDQAPQGGH